MKFIIHRLETCPSTNDVAREMARAGAPEGTVVTADEQTAGRGTKGRSWHSARGKGLYVSVILRPRTASIALLPLAAGLAARDAVETTHGLEARLRWPNDVVFEGRKLGGILCESAFLGNLPDYAILGTGLNLGQAEDDFPSELRPVAVSILMATESALMATGTVAMRAGTPADREALLAELLAQTARRAEMIERGAGDEILADFERRSAFRRGDPIAVLAGGEPVRGEYLGLDADGALVVGLPGGVRRFAAAEIARML